MDAPSNGLICDTSTLITAVRSKHSAGTFFRQVQEVYGESVLALSVITLAELAHGIERAKLEVHRLRSQAFLEDLPARIQVYSITPEIALRAGRISGEQTRLGIVIPFEDLMIGTTALNHGFSVLTENVSHFRLIPGLNVKSL